MRCSVCDTKIKVEEILGIVYVEPCPKCIEDFEDHKETMYDHCEVWSDGYNAGTEEMDELEEEIKNYRYEIKILNEELENLKSGE